MDLAERRTGDHRRHPWEVVRAEFFRSILTDSGLLRTESWLDVGAGDAWFAAELSRFLPSDASITCWDVNYSDDDLDRSIGDTAGGAIRMTHRRPAGPYDTILVLDVAEHVDDDHSFLTDIVRGLLSPGGHVLFSVPANQRLFTSHDEALRHFRRYSPRGARALLTASGLEVISEGGLFYSLLVPRAAQKLIEMAKRQPKRRGAEPVGVGAWEGGALLTSLLTRALAGDAQLSFWLAQRGVRLPGLSYWALCRSTGS